MLTHAFIQVQLTEASSAYGGLSTPHVFTMGCFCTGCCTGARISTNPAGAHRHVRPHPDSHQRIQLAPFVAVHCYIRRRLRGCRGRLVARGIQADARYLVLKLDVRFLHKLPRFDMPTEREQSRQESRREQVILAKVQHCRKYY